MIIFQSSVHGSYGHGKSWNFSKSWKVMENGDGILTICFRKKILELQK